MAPRVFSASKAPHGSLGPAALEHQCQHEHQRQQSNIAVVVAVAALGLAAYVLVFRRRKTAASGRGHPSMVVAPPLQMTAVSATTAQPMPYVVPNPASWRSPEVAAAMDKTDALELQAQVDMQGETRI